MPGKEPLFSVTITTYNHGEYIKSTILSVLKQTVQDFEIIVVDDGSPDDTPEKVSSIKDERILYIRQKPSGRPAYSRNRAIERANGKYITLLDGDDLWAPDKLEKVRNVFLKNPGIDIVCHDIKIMGPNGKFIRRTELGPYPEDMYQKLLWERNVLGISMTTLRREVFFKHNFWFDENMSLFTVEDYDFWLRLAESGKFHFYYLPEPLAEHVVSEKSAILSNIEKHTVNVIGLFDRNIKRHHFDKNPSKRRIARKRRSAMLRSAALSYNYNKEFTKSIWWFKKAAKEDPLNINNYMGLASSALGIKMGRI